MIATKYLTYLRNKNGNAQYMFRPPDFKYLKNQNKNLIFKMLAADLNIICTAKSKPLYDTQDDNFMKIIGTTIDCSKDAPYYFDVVIELKLDPHGKRYAITKKDRTNTLPREFDFDYQTLVSFFGKDDIERETDANLNQLAANTAIRNRSFEATLPDGRVVKTAGISSENLKTIKHIISSTNIKEEVLKAKLVNEYNVESLLDLTEDESSLLITDLTKIEE